jgi:hypothetical protein
VSSVDRSELGSGVALSPCLNFQPPTQQPDRTQIQGAGHIVVVRPQESFPADGGPQVVTAGVQNFKSASVKFAFGDHPLAWPDYIKLFVHDTALE